MDDTTLIIDIATIEETREQVRAALRAGGDETARYTFASRENFCATLTARRLAVIEALLGGEATGVRELARRLGRDVKDVHTDTQKLVTARMIEKTAGGKLIFPYKKVRVEFALSKAA